MASKKAKKDASDPADLFWSIIERVDRASEGDLEPACEAFRVELEALDDSTLIEVVKQFDAAMNRAYDWNLWGAAYLIHGGCSDDTFWDFRAGLVSMGRDVFERALRDPESLSEIEDVEERTLFEGSQYVPSNVLEARGLSAARTTRTPRKPSGKEWEESDLAERFPRTWAKFW